MDKRTKIWLLTATVLVLLGCVIFGGVMMATNWDFSKLSTQKYETNTYPISEEYRNITITTDTADISFVPAQTGSVVCYEEENGKHSVRVEGDTLIIELVKTKKWYDYIGFHFETPKVTLYIPQGEYGALTAKLSTGDLEIPKEYRFDRMDVAGSTGHVTSFASVSGKVKLKTGTGDLYLEGLSAAELDLSVKTGRITAKDVTCTGDVQMRVSTGKTELTNLTCRNLDSEGGTGKLSMENVIAEGKLSIERSTGDVTLTKCDAGEIEIETDTGDVTGSLLTDKIFFAETDTGRIHVPKSLTGGKCEISTDTGNIQLEILP